LTLLLKPMIETSNIFRVYAKYFAEGKATWTQP